MRPNYITLSRTKLYELVWSRPVSELAKEFGISDVALAKRCKAINIPLPPRGYWARVAAGQTPPRTPLPGLRDESKSRAVHKKTKQGVSLNEVRRHRYVVTDDVDGHKEPGVRFAPPNPKESTTAEGIAPIQLPDIPTYDSPNDMLPSVRRTARHYKHPKRAAFSFPRGEAKGPILEFHVSEGLLDRALRFADQFLRSAEVLGWSLVAMEPEEKPESPPRYYGYGDPPPTPKPPPPFGDLLVDGERVTFRIEEAMREERRKPTPQEEARMKQEYRFKPDLVTQHSTGRLRLVRVTGRGHYEHRKSWYDRSSTPVEAQIPEILSGFRERAQSLKAAREEEERRARAWAEQERLRREQTARREENAKLIHFLERQAGAWHRARFLRRYVHAARRILDGKAVTVTLNGQPTDLLAWADEYVAQLDPLVSTPANPDLRADRPYYYGVDQERLKGELARLSGHLWEQASKLVTHGSLEPKDDE